MDPSTALTTVQDWFMPLIPTLNTLIITVLILLIGFIIARIAGHLIFWLLKQVQADIYAKKYLGITLQKTTQTLVTAGISIITVYIVLSRLHVATIALIIVGILVGLFIIVSLALIIFDLFPNFFGGLAIRKHQLFKLGDSLKLKGVIGRVTSRGFFRTVLETSKGEKIVIPNTLFRKKKAFKRSGK
jgi:small-conductance mechanosensitive channel